MSLPDLLSFGHHWDEVNLGDDSEPQVKVKKQESETSFKQLTSRVFAYDGRLLDLFEGKMVFQLT